jgi:hypothetical protein
MPGITAIERLTKDMKLMDKELKSLDKQVEILEKALGRGEYDAKNIRVRRACEPHFKLLP